MKSGIKTTEFWLIIITNIITIINGLQGLIDAKTATIILAILNGIYTTLRTLSKNPEITTIIKN